MYLTHDDKIHENEFFTVTIKENFLKYKNVSFTCGFVNRKDIDSFMSTKSNASLQCMFVRFFNFFTLNPEY